MKKTVVKVQRPEKLIKWQERLEAAKSGQDLSLMDKREFLYLGDRHVEKNINSVNQPKKQSNNIWNIGFEFIESQVNNQIPMPTVKSKREGFDTQAAMIADSISNDIKESDIEAINDRNERITPLQGFSIIEVAWNPNFKHHLYRGEIELIGRHPKQLVTQPKVYNLQKMDYFFILSDVTKDYVQRRYKKDLSGEEEQYPENTRLFDTDQNSSGSATAAQDSEEEPLTEIVCWYKDEDGDICKYVWINDTQLEDLPKFFYRRNNDGTYMETEVLDRDIVDVDGRPIAYKGEKVPMFIPSRYPVSVRINVPRNFHFGGQSDLDVIGDQQDSIKRVVHKMEEKIIKGGSIIKALEDHDRLKITDEIYQIIRGTQQQLAAIGTLDLTADISKDLLYCQEQYRIAQSMLGITNSFQGKEDVTATSGKAKQIQVQQASGRLNSKMFNKNVHFKELFEIIFEHKIAFYDEIRPYLAQDIEGNDSFGEFDKYLLLQRDKRGNLYWNTDFLIGTDGVYGLPKDPMFMYEQTMALFSAQAIDVQQLWTILEGLQFPAASRIKQQWSEKMNQQEQMAQMEQMITELQQQIEQMGGENQQLQGALEQTSQSNAQADADAMQAANEGQRQQYEQQRQQEDSAHQKAMDIAKLQVEASKIKSA
ncbi:hypothetical protein NST58_01735 [Paenibacillus sp. FSL R10-2796]|uniref:hypothetical protein n=1 Tax=Paenibacillus sp. FSL R10-2796 TaxID=2954663 RepID=UPI0030D91EAA